MKLQILIKHYKHEHLTNACLESLKTNIIYPDDVITLIDSTPDSNYRPDVPTEIFSIPNSVGLMESFNRFIHPGFDIYFCLNNDLVLHPSYIARMAELFYDQPEIGIAAPMYDTGMGGILSLDVRYKPSDPEWIDYIMDKLLPHKFEYTNHVDNCAWAFTSKLIDEIGLPDGNFPGAGWFANQDYCYRAIKAGFKVAANKSTFVHHEGSYSMLASDPNYFTNAPHEGNEYLLKKYGGKIPW